MNRLNVWYDGDCPLCRREIALVRRLDKRGAIEFVTSPQRSHSTARSTATFC